MHCILAMSFGISCLNHSLMTNTDLIIIGAGPGGYSTAAYAASKGLKVVVVEKDKLGGVCLNHGCIPTKCLAHDADLLRNPLLPDGGLNFVDFPHIQERKNEVIQKLQQGIETILSQPGITLVKGRAEFTDSHIINVDGDEYSAKNIIIATGSHSKLPPFAVEGMKSKKTKVVTSTELLDIDHVPETLAIVGAGVIGMEFASAFNTFGSKVEVYEFLPECLPTLDKDIAKRLRKTLEKRGIKFHFKYSVENVDDLGAEVVLVATGRGANTEGFGLEKTGVTFDRKGITVDDNMETNVPGVYAIGDVNGRIMLAHAAEWEGKRAVNHILGQKDSIRLDIMPSAIFTYPEAGSVGPTETELKERGVEYTVHKNFFRANGKALSIDETEGMLKLIADKDDKIISCHIFGPHSADIVQEVTALMNSDCTVSKLKDIIHIHPTLGEILI